MIKTSLSTPTLLPARRQPIRHPNNQSFVVPTASLISSSSTGRKTIFFHYCMPASTRSYQLQPPGVTSSHHLSVNTNTKRGKGPGEEEASLERQSEAFPAPTTSLLVVADSL
jgi:hypothetical protein